MGWRAGVAQEREWAAGNGFLVLGVEYATPNRKTRVNWR